MTPTLRIGRYSLGDRPITFILLLAILLRTLVFLVVQGLQTFVPPFDTSPSILAHPSFLSLTNANETRSFEAASVATAASVTKATAAQSQVRWDAVHFTSIALGGYEYEQQFAFQPLWPALVRLAANGLAVLRYWVGGGLDRAGAGARGARGALGGRVEGQVRLDDVVWASVGVGCAAYIGAALMLFKLTAHLFPLRAQPAFPLLATLFYLLPPTPAIPNAGYTEPFFALCTFTALYLAIVKRWYLLSSLAFAAATGVRATGCLAAGVLGWLIVFEGVDLRTISFAQAIKRILIRSPRAILPCSIVVVPFLAFQYGAYVAFCSPSLFLPPGLTPAGIPGMQGDSRRPWCDSTIPFVYSFVQGEYWNVGLLKYWTVAQLPNILLALPVLSVSIIGSAAWLRSSFSPLFASRSSQPIAAARPSHPALLPLHLYSLSMTLLLLCASHTQIALRVSLTDPVIWWNLATMAVDWQECPSPPSPPSPQSPPSPAPGLIQQGEGASHAGRTAYGKEKRGGRTIRLNRLGRLWVGYTVVWGTISLVLWSGFYPPA